MSEHTTPEPFDGTLDGLARIVLQGFEITQGQLDVLGERLDGVQVQIDGVEGRLGGLYNEFRTFRAETEASLSRIELRLTEVPYRFELVDLERRVSRIEGKIGSTPSAT